MRQLQLSGRNRQRNLANARQARRTGIQIGGRWHLVRLKAAGMVSYGFYAAGWEEGWDRKRAHKMLSRKPLILLVAGAGFEPTTFGL